MKKFSIKQILACVLVLVLLLSVCLVGAAKDTKIDITAGLTELEKKEGYQLIAEDSNTSLYFDSKTTNFYVEDSNSQKKVFAYPDKLEENELLTAANINELQSALILTFWDPKKKTENVKNSYGLCVKSGNYKVFSQESGFIIQYEFTTQQVSICLSVKLKDGKLLCSIPKGGIEEKDPNKSMLLRVSVLPYMISGEADTDGEIILPDGCGELMDFSSLRKSAASYFKSIYGRNLSTTLSLESKTGYDITCPFLALVKDETGVLAIPEKGAAVGYVNANPAGKSTPFANAYFSFDYRASDIAIIGDKQTVSSQSTRMFNKSVYEQDITISYQFIFDGATKASLAQLYGEYILPNGTDSNNHHTTIIDVYGFVNEKKSFLGFPYTSTSVLSSGDDILSLSEDKDLEGITLNLKNITNEQRDNVAQTSVKPISKILNNSQLKKLNESNVKVYINTNPLSFKKGNLWANSFFGGSKTIYGAPVGVYEYRESTHMENKNISKKLLIAPTKIGSSVEKITSSVKSLGIDGISSNELGCISYHDYSASGTRADTHSYQEAALKNATQSSGLILSNPNDYAIKYCDALIDIPVCSSNNDLCSGSYPFIQIALGDKISYAVESVNLYRSSETMFLNAISLGSALHYSYILSDTKPINGTELNYLYSADYKALKEMTKEQIKLWKEVNDATKGSSLVDYYKDNENIISVFENGTKVSVDFDKATFEIIS